VLEIAFWKGANMRCTILIVGFSLATTISHAQDANSKACILKSAEMLPHIAGLEIKSSRASPVEGNAGWLRVDLDVVAAGQAETYSYACALGSTGNAMVMGKFLPGQ
jgi:hypothetical protein